LRTFSDLNEHMHTLWSEVHIIKKEYCKEETWVSCHPELMEGKF
jgi:hypothetical protein